MAIDLTVKYPGQISTGDPTGYPYGKAQNETVEGDGTGTPWEQFLVQDFTGFLQALLVGGRLTPSGTPDKVGASQYLDALKQLLQPLAVLSWDQHQFFGQNMLPIDAVSNARVTISPNAYNLAADQLMSTADGGCTWAPSAGSLTPTGVVFLTCAISPAGKAIATGSKGGGTDIQTSAGQADFPQGSWTAITPPGTPVTLQCSLYDPVNSRFIVIGKTASAPYIATCEHADLTTWTQRTVPGSITGSKDALSLVQLGTTIVATWADQTKSAYSIDGGVTWIASTTTLTSGQYRVVAGEKKFVAVRKNGTEVYNSSDGITWTAQAALVRVPGQDFERWGLKFLGGVYILSPASRTRFYYSLNDGASWTEVAEQNYAWVSFCVIRNRLLQFRYLTNGGNIDVYVERSMPTALPT